MSFSPMKYACNIDNEVLSFDQRVKIACVAIICDLIFFKIAMLFVYSQQ